MDAIVTDAGFTWCDTVPYDGYDAEGSNVVTLKRRRR
jgi:hypothetical protein